jgi:diguanylate cyclase (GGDEF)-like protein
MDRLADLTRSSAPCAVLMIDLDGFKDVNDTLGHTAGDAVLVEVAHRVLGCTKPIDTVARLGGDEFAMIISGADLAHHAALRADCLIDALAKPIGAENQVVHVSASVGIALYPQDGEHAEDLLSAADLAMYQAKGEGRDCRRFFTPMLREAAVRRHAFEGEIRGALKSGKFVLFYQPQVDARSGVMIGVEALLRWQHPTAGLLTPDRFLSSIETGSCAADVGQWVLEQACRDAVTLRRTVPDLTVGVNLFGAQFRTGSLADDVAEVLARTGLPAAGLELEITENIILRHDETMLRPLRQLRAMGVGIAFDDFGTGFASLSLLKRYPISRIKIDRSFVRDICEDKADAAIVTATIYLAGELGLDVIAEGVETEAQRDLVRACGCHTIQGFLYGPPVPIHELRLCDRDIDSRSAVRQLNANASTARKKTGV